MTYSQQQISLAVNSIVDQLQYNHNKLGPIRLSGQQYKDAVRVLHFYLSEVAHKNPSKIVIAPPSDKFTTPNKFVDYFASLANGNLLFPENTIFVLMPNITYIKQNGERKDIYDRKKYKGKAKMKRVHELEEMLHDMQIDDSSSEDENMDCSPAYTPLQATKAITLQEYVQSKPSASPGLGLAVPSISL